MPPLNQLTSRKKSHIIKHIEICSFTRFQDICFAQEEGDSVFMIYSGECEIMLDTNIK